MFSGIPRIDAFNSLLGNIPEFAQKGAGFWSYGFDEIEKSIWDATVDSVAAGKLSL